MQVCLILNIKFQIWQTEVLRSGTKATSWAPPSLSYSALNASRRQKLQGDFDALSCPELREKIINMDSLHFRQGLIGEKLIFWPKGDLWKIARGGSALCTFIHNDVFVFVPNHYNLIINNWSVEAQIILSCFQQQETKSHWTSNPVKMVSR